MRLKLFKETSNSGKEYWSFTTKAYQHEECKLKWFVKFTKKCIEPIAQKGYANQREYSYADIDVQECALENTTEYNGKINPIITIFAYNEVAQPKQQEEVDLEVKVEEFKQDNLINIEQENLPLY